MKSIYFFLFSTIIMGMTAVVSARTTVTAGEPSRDSGGHISREATQQDPDRVITDSDRAIRMNPGNASAYLQRGKAWKAKGEFERAIRDFDQATRLDPKILDTPRRSPPGFRRAISHFGLESWGSCPGE